MGTQWKKNGTQDGLANSLGISTCVYPPQENKHGLPEYPAGSAPDAPVAAQGEYIVSPAVLPWGFSASEDWQALLDSALGRNRRKTDTQRRGAGREDGLEALLQTIVEHGQEMLPLLGCCGKRPMPTNASPASWTRSRTG